MEQINLPRYLICSFAFVLLYPTAIDLYLVALPQIANDLSASESQLHIAFSIYLAGLASTMVFVGRVADCFGRKPVAICGAVIFTLASMFAGSAETSNSFLIMRFFQGVGAACCYVVAFAILRDTLGDPKRAKVLSMLNGIICSIPVLAPVIGNLIMIKFPWPVLFTAMAMMGIAIGLIACFVLKETLPKTKRTTLNVSEASNESLSNRFFISRVIYTSLGVTAILLCKYVTNDNNGFDWLYSRRLLNHDGTTRNGRYGNIVFSPICSVLLQTNHIDVRCTNDQFFVGYRYSRGSLE